MIVAPHLLKFFRSLRVLAATRASAWAALPLLALALLSAPARAEVWGYVDAKDITHFSSTRLDERYELFFRGTEGFAAGKGEKRIISLAAKNATNLSAGAAYTPSKLLAYFDVSPNYKAVKHLLKEAAETHGIDYELLQALIATESGFDTFAVSPKGAVGLMQLIPPTAERYGVRADKSQPVEKKLTDPKTNIGAGSSYLRDLIKMFPGQLELAVAAYNAGEGAVQRAGNKIPNYPETKNYVKTVMQLYNTLKPPAAVVAEVRRSEGRVRMEMMGGAAGRGNMLPDSVVPPSNTPQDVAANPEPLAMSASKTRQN